MSYLSSGKNNDQKNNFETESGLVGYTVDQVIKKKLVKNPETVYDQPLEIAKSVILANFSEQAVDVVMMKGIYKQGDIIDVPALVHQVVSPGQQLNKEVAGTYSFVFKYQKRGLGQSLIDVESSKYPLESYGGYTITFGNGQEFKVTKTQVPGQQANTIYWMLGTKDYCWRWSIDIYFDQELIENISSDKRYNMIKSETSGRSYPTNMVACYKTRREYTCFLVESASDNVFNPTDESPKYIVASEVEYVAPGQTFVVAQSKTVSTEIVTVVVDSPQVIDVNSDNSEVKPGNNTRSGN